MLGSGSRSLYSLLHSHQASLPLIEAIWCFLSAQFAVAPSNAYRWAIEVAISNDLPDSYSHLHLASDLQDGVLDPFPLLLEIEEATVKRGPCKLVNPLLLVTEKKLVTYTLHHRSFPLNAFHTEGAEYWWLASPSGGTEIRCYSLVVEWVRKQHTGQKSTRLCLVAFDSNVFVG